MDKTSYRNEKCLQAVSVFSSPIIEVSFRNHAADQQECCKNTQNNNVVCVTSIAPIKTIAKRLGNFILVFSSMRHVIGTYKW